MRLLYIRPLEHYAQFGIFGKGAIAISLLTYSSALSGDTFPPFSVGNVNEIIQDQDSFSYSSPKMLKRPRYTTCFQRRKLKQKQAHNMH